MTVHRPCDRCALANAHLCEPRVEHVVRFFERALVHTKGPWARLPFVLSDWQRESIIRPLFGAVVWSAEFGRFVRRHRIGWVELARKNGKSELLAGVALVLLVADGEEGAEVYSVAGDRPQARKVWDVAKRMVELSPLLSKRLDLYAHTSRIVDPRTASYYQAVSADAPSNLGHNPHGVMFDEVLTQPSPALWDAFRTAGGARPQPLMLGATTAGADSHAFVASEHAYSERIARRPGLDPRRFVFIRNTPPEADPFDERNWGHANPALGQFLSVEALRDEAREAKLSPVKLNSFRQFRLNQWVQATTRWLDLRRWDAGGGGVRGFDEFALRGRRCYGGLDLASTQDLTALAWVFPPEDTESGPFDVLWRHWVPEARLPDLTHRTGGQAAVWARAGRLQTTPGDVLDTAGVLAQIDADAQTFDVAEIAYDPWGMTQMMVDLQNAGLTVVPFRQGFASLSGPSKELERLVLQRRLHHHGDPVARWEAANVVVRRDPAGNIKPDKSTSAEKIDGIVAAVMGLGRAMLAPVPRRSAYADHGLLVV